MARIRSAKPEWWSNAKWCALPRDIRSTFKGIWEVMCDDYGRFVADSRLIKSDVWPLDDDIKAKHLEKWLKVLETVMMTGPDGQRMPSVLLYTVNSVRYGYLPGFVEHQKISHPTPSKVPAPPQISGNPQKKTPTSGAGAEREQDVEKSGSGGANPASPSESLGKADREPNAEQPASWSDQLLSHLAPGAARKTRREMQLYLTGQLVYRGHPLGGTQDRLDEMCRRTMEAIGNGHAVDRPWAYVLTKLADTSDGSAPGVVVEAKRAADREAADHAGTVDLSAARVWFHALPSDNPQVTELGPMPSDPFRQMAWDAELLSRWRRRDQPPPRRSRRMEPIALKPPGGS